MAQTKLHSLLESIVNTAVGLLTALVGTQAVVWAYNMPMSFEQNVILTFWMTVISIARGYVIRRWFDYRTSNVRTHHEQ